MKITIGKLKKIISEALEMKDEFGNVLPQLPPDLVVGARVRMATRAKNDELVNYGVVTHVSPATQEGGGQPALIGVELEEDEPDHHGPDPDYDDDLEEPEKEVEEWEMELVTDENGGPVWEEVRGFFRCDLTVVPHKMS